MGRAHHYKADMQWAGNLGTGTSDYRAYSRNYSVRVQGKPELAGSSDAAFRGDRERYNPEDLLVISLSACHMLSYLHVAAVNHVVVVEYTDQAEGTFEENDDGGGRFTEVVLHPRVTISSGSEELAMKLHESAHERCFIASSVNFPVRHFAQIMAAHQDRHAGPGAGTPSEATPS